MVCRIDIIGQTFGRFTVLARGSKTKKYLYMWLVVCNECGNMQEMCHQYLKLHLKTYHSCTCYRNGKKRSRQESLIRKVWSAMIGRCYNPKMRAYKNYGGRGITVCDEWRNSFKSFYMWSLSNGYTLGLHCDRENNDGPYSPNNCRWVSRLKNNRNTRRNKIVTIFGERMPLSEAVERYSVLSYHVVKSRLNRGKWSDEEAVILPKLKPHSKGKLKNE